MLDFCVFQTPSTVPRKQRCSFIECHIFVFPEMIALCFLLPGCSSFFCITRMSLNSWVAWLQLGNAFLNLRENPSGQSVKLLFHFIPQHLLNSTQLFLSSISSSPTVLTHILFHPTPIPTGASQPSPDTLFYFWSPPSFILGTIIVFQLVSLFQYFHLSNPVFLW